MHKLRKPLIFVSLILVAGCADLTQTTHKVFPPAGLGLRGECSDILSFYDDISGLRYQALKNVKTRLAKQRNNSGCAQLKLAVLESMPHSPLQNTAESAQLLREYLNKKRYSSPDERNLARMLLAHVLQTRRFLARQKALKENAGNVEKQSEQLEQLSEENQDLNKKLDQLKKIDRDISRKEQSVINPTNGDAGQ